MFRDPIGGVTIAYSFRHLLKVVNWTVNFAGVKDGERFRKGVLLAVFAREDQTIPQSIGKKMRK